MSFTKFAQEKDAASFREAFLEKIQSAVADEIEQQKIAVAQSMFGSEDQLEEEMSDEELDEYLYSLTEEELEALAEEVEQLDEISKGAAIRAAGVAGSNDDPRTTSIINRIHKKFGSKASDDAEAHASAQYYGRSGKSRGTDPLNSVLDRPTSRRITKKEKLYPQDQRALASAIKGRMKMHGGKSPLPEEVEQMDEAKKPKFEVGHKVQVVGMPSMPAHGHTGVVSKIHPDGQISVRLGKRGKYVSGKMGGGIGGEWFGNSTTVHPRYLKHLPEDYEQMNELSDKLMQRAIDKANRMADRAYDKGHEYSGREYEDQAGRIQAGLDKRKTKKFIQRDLGSMSPAKRRKAEAKRSREPVVTNDD